LTTTEITNLKNNGVFPSSGLVYNNSFGISPPSSSGGYHYEPFLTVNSHNDVVSIPSTQNLQLSKFSVAAWFKTTTNFGDEAYIVNKGGHGTDSSGQNMNYGIWMTSSEKIQGGLETSGGTDRMVTSPNSYNDGQWHHGVVTFDGSTLRLYVDGVQISTLSTTSIPETVGNHPLKIGANSRIVSNLFTGSIDEVGVWNRALTTTEIANLMNNGVFSTNGLVYSNSFNSSSPPPAVVEICNNGIDDDGDGLIDSLDFDDCPLLPPPSSKRLIPISVVASSQSLGKEAPKAADGDFASRWTADGDGEFIEFTFNAIYPITKVGLTGYHYDKTYFFEINGKQFQNPANRPPNTLIEYDLSDLNIQSNKVKIIGHGNSGSSYNSYREIQFYTNSTTPPPPPEICDNGIDDDGDGFIDAADPDCQTSETCTNLPISSVQANGFQSGNPPQNAIDNNLNTRWSQEGIGSSIQLDLGVQKLICSVDIAWYSGNQRQNNFVISVSSDGTTFNNIFTGRSSGTTLSPEKYDIADVNARYIKITVNGNTQNQWASITEIDVYGRDPSSQPQPVNFKFAYKFGTEGTGNGQFLDPHDVSFDSSGNVFVPDRDRNDIQKFTHEGVFLSKFGGLGSGPGQFNFPYSIAHDSNNNIYVSDRENNRIQKLTSDGVFITELKSINGKNFVMPEDLAFDFTNGDLYITDTGNNRIVKLDKNLNFILQWGSKGTGDGQFDHPHAIDVGPDRNVYVSSGFQPYIQKFDPNGKFIKKWGKEGSGDGEMLMFLEHLDVDSEGRVFLINNNIRPVVQVWDSEGNYLTKFGSEKEGSADGQLSEPEHVTVDNDGKPFIVDSGNFRIQVFTPEVVSTAELNPIKKTQPSSDMIPKDLLSSLPSMVSPFNLQ
ncbi:MAG TPA: LamG-like jellyroll fold domain-containing protein, partial [Nitrososphaeraceae archaeon]|nr:LamG-like jellyroll fold domain-containing protein [Nitrososphaeraceae archaeon]